MDSTVEMVAREFCSNGRIKSKALKAVGYSHKYADSGRSGQCVFGNARVKAAIARIDAKDAKKLDHTRELAIQQLLDDYANLAEKAKIGHVQAIQARTSITKELNAISNLHSNLVLTRDLTPKTMTPAERDACREMAIKLTSSSVLDDTG